MRKGFLGPVAAAVLVLSGCGAGPAPTTASPSIDVDTPQLRQLKQQAGIEPCQHQTGDPVDGGLPNVTLPCLGGGPAVDLAGLRGPLVVNLWGSYCGPCRKEMPVLQQFHEKYGDRVGVLGVDYEDAQTASALELARKSGVTYPLVADTDGALQGNGPFPVRMGLPLFAFVDQDGHVELAAGGVGSVAELEQLVDQHLGLNL
ncbi:TlpA family protein disulfide reductase [Nocardioides panaciterrulae]|uniref:Thiol-disulfide isomerase/thioredoxin n=1 Tax=Nocardioides panaciterrulae TaxID=661492 RepID=A0A7Y9JC86_9ACTN|nr:TlpA disulfide reductase family protein [Nocardioides panaciterrulae]NYD43627.1 thiol-disulfide isomerase/thioredoxin [Nocardioides panaciterrulae]